MKKAALLLALLLLCGCSAAQPAQTLPPATQAPAIEAVATEAPVTEPPVTQAPTTAPTEPPITVYEGAVEDFMEPIEDNSWEREHDVEFVMLHFTSYVVADREDPYNLEAIRKTYTDYGVSTHYLVDRDGTIYCYIPEDRVAWHAGEGTWGGDEKYTDKMNFYAIGIELLGIGTQEDMASYLHPEEYAALDPSIIGFTDAQYTAVQELVADLCLRYDIPADREHIIGHDEFSPDNTDPGDLLDWSRVLPNT